MSLIEHLKNLQKISILKILKNQHGDVSALLDEPMRQRRPSRPCTLKKSIWQPRSLILDSRFSASSLALDVAISLRLLLHVLHLQLRLPSGGLTRSFHQERCSPGELDSLTVGQFERACTSRRSSWAAEVAETAETRHLRNPAQEDAQAGPPEATRNRYNRTLANPSLDTREHRTSPRGKRVT